MSAKVHLHMHVSDLAKSRDFYEKFLGGDPVKVKQGYVKFLPEWAPVNLALSTGGPTGAGTIDHVGVQVESVETVMSQLSVLSASLTVDGAQTQTIAQGDPQVFSTATTLTGGAHAIGVVAKDSAARETSSQITVNVVDRCVGGGACANDFHCLGGYCLPGAKVPGGLGAPCVGNSDCITGQCGSDAVGSAAASSIALTAPPSPEPSVSPRCGVTAVCARIAATASATRASRSAVGGFTRLSPGRTARRSRAGEWRGRSSRPAPAWSTDTAASATARSGTPSPGA